MFCQFIFAEPKRPPSNDEKRPSKRQKTTDNDCSSVGSTCTCGDNCQCGDNCKCHKCSSKNNSASSSGSGGSKGGGSGGSKGGGSDGGSKGGGSGGGGGGSGGGSKGGGSGGGGGGSSGRKLSFKPVYSLVEYNEDGTYSESEQRKGPISIETFFFSSGKRKCKNCAWGIHHKQRAHVSQCPKCGQLRPIDGQPFDRLGILERINDGQTLTDMFISQRLSMSLEEDVSEIEGIHYLIDYLQRKIDTVESGTNVGIAQIIITRERLPLVNSLKERLEKYLITISKN